MRIIYTLLLYIAYPLIYLKLKKRFGKDYIRLRKNPNIKGEFDCIVHGASVGEQVLIKPFVDALIRDGKRILLTCATDTGLKKAEDNFGKEESVAISYLPFDFPFSLKRFFRNVKANSLILVETELWPNTIFYAKKYGLKLFLINGRISDKSFPNYKRFSFFLKRLFDNFERVIVRSEKDFERFVQIGCERGKLRVCGNLKLANKPEVRHKIVVETNLPIVVFGSTRDYEEGLILEGLKELIGKVFSPIFVPRHIERVEEIVKEVRKHGFNPVLSNGKSNFKLDSRDILIVNETGKLVSFYAIADLCFVGGSLVDFGGQNFAEPLFLGKPVITGKFLSNFEDLKELLSDYFTIVENTRELRFFIENFFEKRQYFIERSVKASKLLENNLKSLNCTLGEVEC